MARDEHRADWLAFVADQDRPDPVLDDEATIAWPVEFQPTPCETEDTEEEF